MAPKNGAASVPLKIKPGQFRTGNQAKKTCVQHTRPCADCPFARAALPGWLGRLSPEEWIRIVHGEGVVECHTTDKLCAGAAIYRANVCKVPRDPSALRLPADRVVCFASITEFLQHHRRGL